jgi:hypothetical protein
MRESPRAAWPWGPSLGAPAKIASSPQFWDGSSWKARPSAAAVNDGGSGALQRDVHLPTACTAVAQFRYQLGSFLTVIAPLILRWNGTEWRFEHSANATNSLDTGLSGIACPSSNLCIAVGSERHSGGNNSPFAETWDGTGWTLRRPADLKGSTGTQLTDVACASATRCFAVGFVAHGSDAQPLVESWDGTRWSVVPTTAPQGATSSVLTTIACDAPDQCLAGGIYRSNSPTSTPIRLGGTDRRGPSSQFREAPDRHDPSEAALRTRALYR